jgi:2,4-dienoyl-CoA reductase-like NADH-dependent reductase (Old Yellow Enzyme family)
MAFTHVHTPFRIGTLALKNRIVRSAHGTNIGQGTMSADLIAYHAARARGGVALSIMEITGVHRSSAGLLNVWDPLLQDGMRRLVDACRPHGMKIVQQLWHGGIQGHNLDGGFPWAPSDIASHKMNTVPEPMTEAMIADVIEGFATATRLCEQWGIDGVEIHCAHSYLPHQFLSPAWNHRTDRYGGSFDNRARFMVETLEAVRAAASPDFAVGVRVSPDYQDGSLPVDDVIRATRLLEARNLIDFVDISAGNYTTDYKMIGGMHEPVGYEMETSAPVARALALPTIVTGRFRTLDDADLVIRQGQADLVAITRGTIADPDLVNTSLAGNGTGVRPCIGCNQGCVGGIMRAITGPGGVMGCTVNPAVGFEATIGDDRLVPAADPRKVLVIGGGVGGMEAARVAALRGHKVVLAEAAPDLGGMVRIAARQPTRHAIQDIVVWQQNAIYALGVDVRLSTFMDADDIAAEAPDAVIIATGSTPRLDGIQVSNPGEPAAGMDQPHVLSSIDLFTTPGRDLGRTALVVDDVGHYEAMGVAEELLDRGLHVTFVTRHAAIAHQLDGMFMASPTLGRFAQDRFTAHARTRLVSVEQGSATITPIHDVAPNIRARRTVPADTVVFVSYNRSNRDLYDALREGPLPVRIVGDARNPRTMQEAIREGYLAGMDI